MRLIQLRLKNFQSFGAQPTTVKLSGLTFVLGPNGSGKTAVLVALARLFSPDNSLRRVRPSDFHLPLGSVLEQVDNELWLEVDIEFKETTDEGGNHPSIPPFFAHMALEKPDEVPRVRIRLTARLDVDGYVEERLEYINQIDATGEPVQRSTMSRHDRAAIEVHYLPARRDPVDHIAFSATSLLGRMLRAADWTQERDEMARLADELSDTMVTNAAVDGIGAELKAAWGSLHRGSYFKEPSIAFGRGKIEGVLRQLTMVFEPSPGVEVMNFERLSDGQKSLLYLALVLAWRGMARQVVKGEVTAFDPNKLRPPVHVILALEEPENSLAPQHLGRVLSQLRSVCAQEDVQALVATHSPALLHRVEPANIRFLRLAKDRTTRVRTVVMPSDAGDAAKFVREAVRAFPELYFARLVILVEGDSEQIVLHRVLAAAGIAEDDISVSVVPIGGRHVHHFWRLLEGLGIPYVTILDLDGGRYGGGWGRMRYVASQLNQYRPGTVHQDSIDNLPPWDSDLPWPAFSDPKDLLPLCEREGVFFSHPLDLDLMMLEAYPDAYGVVDRTPPSKATIEAVLGKSHCNIHHYSEARLALFSEYQMQFKLRSKPASHLSALAAFDGRDDELLAGLPAPLTRLLNAVQERLESIPE